MRRTVLFTIALLIGMTGFVGSSFAEEEEEAMQARTAQDGAKKQGDTKAKAKKGKKKAKAKKDAKGKKKSKEGKGSKKDGTEDGAIIEPIIKK